VACSTWNTPGECASVPATPAMDTSFDCIATRFIGPVGIRAPAPRRVARGRVAFLGAGIRRKSQRLRDRPRAPAPTGDAPGRPRKTPEDPGRPRKTAGSPRKTSERPGRPGAMVARRLERRPREHPAPLCSMHAPLARDGFMPARRGFVWKPYDCNPGERRARDSSPGRVPRGTRRRGARACPLEESHSTSSPSRIIRRVREMERRSVPRGTRDRSGPSAERDRPQCSTWNPGLGR